jgi:hypothetical protein
MAFTDDNAVLSFLKNSTQPTFNHESLNARASEIIEYLKQRESKENVYFSYAVLVLLLSHPHDFIFKDEDESIISQESHPITRNAWTVLMAECALIYLRTHHKHPPNPLLMREYFALHRIPLVNVDTINKQIKTFFDNFHSFISDDGLYLKGLAKSQIECSVLLGHYYLLQSKIVLHGNPQSPSKKSAVHAYQIFLNGYGPHHSSNENLFDIINRSSRYHKISKDIKPICHLVTKADNNDDSDSNDSSNSTIERSIEDLHSPLLQSPIANTQSLVLPANDLIAKTQSRLAVTKYQLHHTQKTAGNIHKTKYWLRSDDKPKYALGKGT